MGWLIQTLRLLKNYKTDVFLNLVFNILTTILSLFSFASVAPFLEILFNAEEASIPAVKPELSFSSDAILNWINYYVNSYIVNYGPEGALIYFCGFIIFIFSLKNLARYLSLYVLAPIRVGVIRDIRQQVHNKILLLPLSFYSEERKGDIISRVTNDAQEIEVSIISSLEMVFRDPITITVYLGAMLFMNWKITLFVLVILPIAGLLISFIGKSLRGASMKGQGKLGEVLSIIEETLSGLRVIKGFNAEDIERNKFKKVNNDYFRLMLKLYRKQHLSSPLSEALSAIVLAVVIWYGGTLVLNSGDSGFTGAFFITFVVIFSQIIPPIKSLSEAYFKIQKGLASIDRINNILDAEESIKDPDNPLELNSFDDCIEFRNLSFKYQDKTVLKKINLTIKKGQKVALVGPSGSGKTTLANLLPRFYDPTEGDILIDGKSLRDCRVKDIRNLMGIVSQESILFNDTIANNIRLSTPDAPDEMVMEAAKIANAAAFIREQENGFETNVGDGGGKLSGGQKQRVSIARAVLKNPPIMILDEATSALDTESEKLVQDALNNLMQNRTSLVIAHRLSTIQHADVIVVLDQGSIEEMGTHEELLAANGIYKRLCDLQSFR